MNLLFVVDSLGKGGLERRMLELVKHICRKPGYKITLVCLTDHVEYPDVYTLPVEFIILKRRSKKDPAVFKKLYQIIRSRNIDVVHSWSSMSNIYVLPVAKLLRKKFITSAIADSPQGLSLKNPVYLRARLVFPFADRITSNSLAGLKAYRAPERKSRCIYNGFDDKRISALGNIDELKTSLGITNQAVIGMVAGFEDRKDYATMIAAAIKVLQKCPDTIFLLVGGGPLLQSLKESVPDAFKDRILFLGKINDVEAYIKSFDVAVLCTNTRVHQEGISNSIMEYMALSKPVLATAGGGTNEIVQDGITGFLVPPHNAEVLAEKMEQLVKDPELRMLLGAKGRRRITDLFSIERMCSQFYQLYQEMV